MPDTKLSELTMEKKKTLMIARIMANFSVF